MRIIAGKYKNSLIPTNGFKHRPTKSKVREAIFNILQNEKYNQIINLENAHIIDVFSGSGSLALEAISRGAKTATLIEINHTYFENVKFFAEKHQINNIFYINKDASKLTDSTKQYDIIFMDPPYKEDIIYKTLENMFKNNWLSHNSLIFIEHHAKHNIENICDIRKNFNILKTSKYGDTMLTILRYKI